MRMEKLVTSFSQDLMAQGNDDQHIDRLMRSKYSWFGRKTDDWVELDYFVAKGTIKKGRH